MESPHRFRASRSSGDLLFMTVALFGAFAFGAVMVALLWGALR